MLLEVNMSGLSLLTGCWFRLKSKGEWSDDRFERELALIRFRGMFFVTAKSLKSVKGNAVKFIARFYNCVIHLFTFRRHEARFPVRMDIVNRGGKYTVARAIL